MSGEFWFHLTDLLFPEQIQGPSISSAGVDKDPMEGTSPQGPRQLAFITGLFVEADNSIDWAAFEINPASW